MSPDRNDQTEKSRTLKERVEPTTLRVTAITECSFNLQGGATRLGSLCDCCYKFNVICGESPRCSSMLFSVVESRP